MFYPKREEKKLNDDLFRNPTSEYRAAPFWAWNYKLDAEDLCWQIEQFKKMGFGGFFMHSRSGLDTEYLSKDFMDVVKKCVDKAQQEGMLACLYDEDRYSSGFAGGLLTMDPRYRQRRLLFTETWKETVDRETAEKEGKRYLVATYDIVLNCENELQSYRLIDKDGFCNQTVEIGKHQDDCRVTRWYAYSEVVGEPGGWFNHGTYVDAFSKEALDKFIEITHEKYKKVVGEKFGKTVPMIFTDELWHTFFETFDTSEGGSEAKLPWSNVLEKEYRDRFGSEITEQLPEALWQRADGQPSTFRYRLHDFYTKVFNEAFTANVGAWCKENGIALTGHMMGEETLVGQTSGNGEEMPAYRNFQIPGIDMFGNDYFYTCAKQTQSIVHQDGREAMSSELYGVTNWDFDFRGHKSQGDWQAALGVTIRVPHLSMASMKGEGKRDYPASISYQAPWYTEYRYLEDHYARINTALTRGKPIVKVGVIHPVESCWINYGPKDKTLDHITGLDQVFHDVCRWLLEGQIDFDYICESELPAQVGDISKRLNVGQMRYDAVVVAGCETLRSSTLDILEKFQAQGGKIVFAGKAPLYEDAVASNRPKNLSDRCQTVQLDAYSLVNALEDERLVTVIENQTSKRSDNCVYQLREDNECLWLFIANMRRLDKEHKNHVEARERTIRIKGEFTPLLYDTLSGEIKEIDFDVQKGYTYIYHTFYQSSSLLLQLNPVTQTSLRVLPQKAETVKTELVFSKVEYQREEPNVLLFDGGEWRIDAGSYRPYEDIRKIYRNCMQELGYQVTWMQPWAKKKPERIEHSVGLRFRFESELELTGAKLACENGEQTKVLFNGQPVEMKAEGYFTDKAIKTYALPKIKEGSNVLEVELPFGECSEIENYFVLGEFNVRLEGLEKTLSAPTGKIGFGDVAGQGMPFYGGTLHYRMPICAPQNTDAWITVNSFAGPVVGVRLDGKDIGHIAFSPYKVKAENIAEGEHVLELILYGNRYNSFAPLHTVSFEEVFVGPPWWKFEIDDACAFKYEYELRRFGIFGSPKIEYVKRDTYGR